MNSTETEIQYALAVRPTQATVIGLTSDRLDLLYGAVEVTNEATIVLNTIKYAVFYGLPFDTKEVVQALDTLEIYTEIIRNLLTTQSESKAS